MASSLLGILIYMCRTVTYRITTLSQCDLKFPEGTYNCFWFFSLNVAVGMGPQFLGRTHRSSQWSGWPESPSLSWTARPPPTPRQGYLPQHNSLNTITNQPITHPQTHTYTHTPCFENKCLKLTPFLSPQTTNAESSWGAAWTLISALVISLQFCSSPLVLFTSSKAANTSSIKVNDFGNHFRCSPFFFISSTPLVGGIRNK